MATIGPNSPPAHPPPAKQIAAEHSPPPLSSPVSSRTRGKQRSRSLCRAPAWVESVPPSTTPHQGTCYPTTQRLVCEWLGLMTTIDLPKLCVLQDEEIELICYALSHTFKVDGNILHGKGSVQSFKRRRSSEGERVWLSFTPQNQCKLH